jgi:hypothetical protein
MVAITLVEDMAVVVMTVLSSWSAAGGNASFGAGSCHHDANRRACIPAEL